MTDPKDATPLQPDDSAPESIDKFDELEKGFRHVIQSLSADDSLVHFRAEYEKMFTELTQARQKNFTLLDECRQLNNTILANTSKVSTILNLSQSDQRTISGLRSEFEKAWKTVEIGEQRDMQSKETIDSLQSEIATLSRLIEHGGAEVLTRQRNLEALADENAQLRREIALQSRQLAKLRDDLDASSSSAASLRGDLARLRADDASLRAEWEQLLSSAAAVSAGVCAMGAEASAVKCDLAAQRGALDALAARARALRESVSARRAEFARQRGCAAAAAEDRASSARGAQALREAARGCARAQCELAQRARALEAGEARLAEAEGALAAVEREREGARAALREACERRRALCGERAAVARRARAGGEAIARTEAEANRLGMLNGAARMLLDRAHGRLHGALARLGAERRATDGAAQRGAVDAGEILAVRRAAELDQQHVARVDREMAGHEGRVAHARNNTLQIDADRAERVARTNARVAELRGMNAALRQQAAFLEALRNERDMTCRQAELIARENGAVLEENAVLAAHLELLKTEMRTRDRQCVEVHCEQKRVVPQIRALAAMVSAKREEIQDVNDEATQLRNRISRARILLADADLDARKVRQVIADVADAARCADHRGIAGAREVAALGERAKVLLSLIARSATSYDRQARVVDGCTRELQQALARQRFLLTRRQHARALRLEAVRLHKSLVRLAGQAQALEHEIEKPCLVHRWRFLERVNPQLARLISLNVELHDRVTKALAREERLRAVRDRWRARYAKLEGHLQRSFGGRYGQEMKYYADLLRDKTRLLAQMERQVAAQQTDLWGQKDTIRTVRTLVREEKAEMHETKKIMVKIRAKTAIGGRRKKAERPESRFVGGGFAIGGVQLQDAPLSARRQGAQTQIAEAPLSARRQGAQTQIAEAPPLHTPRRTEEHPKMLSARRPGSRLPLQPIAALMIG